MELAQHDALPHLIELLLGIFVALVLHRGDGSQQLEVVQHHLGPAVVQLCARLRRVDAAVQLKVQLAVPRDEAVGLGLQAVEELVDGRADVDARDDARGVGHAAEAPEALEVLPGRAAAAVAFSELRTIGK